MKIKNVYKSRFIRPIRLHRYNDWQIKMYSITIENGLIDPKYIDALVQNLPQILSKKNNHDVEHYNIATVIIHRGIDACFAIINWWVNENMLQHHVFLIDENYQLIEYSNNEIITCVWEMAILWHERNAWIKHILAKPDQPDVEEYLIDCIEADL